MENFEQENLVYDPLHGYIPIVSSRDLPKGEVSERSLIDHPWLQRMRQIHQLQTAWWVFPSAEHTRFPHILGAMHMGSRWSQRVYDSLREVCPETPSLAYVESLMRMTGLLHDVGHGPFGHFFDEHFLSQHGLTHETLGAYIVVHELGEMIRGIRRNPNGVLEKDERLDPRQIAFLMTRPRPTEVLEQPKWLILLRGLLSGIYTIDNMDFVLRDAYMTGYSQHAYDVERLLHYSFFTERGLTIHDKGIDGLVRFLSVRAELFRSIYFHRTVRAIDLMLADLFRESYDLLFDGNPLDHLDRYLEFTETALLIDVGRWKTSSEPRKRSLANGWQDLLQRRIVWRSVCQRSLVFHETDPERASIFSDAKLVESQIRRYLPEDLRNIELRVDIARHIHRPHTHGPASDQNFLYDSSRQLVRRLGMHSLYQRLPVAHRICRVYAPSDDCAPFVAAALDELLGDVGEDDLTNM
jgi:uncharacterized protein